MLERINYQESDENIEEIKEKAGVNQLGETDENPNGGIDENEEEVGKKELDGHNGNKESNENMEETEEQEASEGNQLGQTDENPNGEIVEYEEENCKNEEEEEKERRRRAIKQGKQLVYKGGPFEDYEEKNEGKEFDFDKWSW
ncbi:uncharacterized protein LOC125809290 [Solanum verrucosum]|uniref:uncharacterized protein LOC125809290 n=1 Tax=Solanum verrucosum TaxID=315347 RepID=UPI0020D1B859|nr:uncharacterized protein LOC125809290 [Solanum verrucosum]